VRLGFSWAAIWLVPNSHRYKSYKIDFRKIPAEEQRMSKVRVLVGTRKGAFILTADGKRQNWEVSGPHFAGWELYHLKGSPADPNRIYASQDEWMVWANHSTL
jgi:hypothetical protein